MAGTTSADGTTGGTDLPGRLTEMSDRTNLMVIDATLRALPGAAPGQDTGFADAAEEIRALARRMLQATQDLQAVLCEPAR